jgi:hypothetical protein
MSGTFKTIGTANATCAAARCVTLLTRCNHPRVGQNLLMARADRLDGDTGTTVVSQRSESGLGILAAKAGRGKYDVLYDMVWKDVVSFMSVGCSLTVLCDTPPFLVITVHYNEHFSIHLLDRVGCSYHNRHSCWRLIDEVSKTLRPSSPPKLPSSEKITRSGKNYQELPESTRPNLGTSSEPPFGLQNFCCPGKSDPETQCHALVPPPGIFFLAAFPLLKLF